jgi:hypothetical protein
MEAAQCVNSEDYKKIESWVAQVKKIAEERCK